MMSELEKLIEKWEQEKGSYIPNAPIYQCFIDEAKEALEKEKNKWIKIECEKDLPKNPKFQEFHVYAHDGVFINNENIGIDSWWGYDEDKKNDWLSNYTHYQPIQKPEPPLF